MSNKIAQFVNLIRSTKREKKLGTVIFFVTSRCNSFCETCFYHEELNKAGDLTFAEIEKVSETMPPITDLWLSGGEPMLRKDLSKIIDLFVTKNGVNRVIIPTNGLLKPQTYETVERALTTRENLHFYLNVALDGYGKTHDKIRGVPRNWERTLDCIENLYALKDRFTNRFRLNVNTVVCADNFLEIDKLSQYLWQNFRLDGHYFNLVRGETKVGESIKQIPLEVLPEMYRKIGKLTAKYGERMFENDSFSHKFIKQAAYVGTITTHYKTQHENFDKPTAWKFPCTAGETVAVIDYNGDVRACELREKFSSLKDFDFNFGELWEAESRQIELNQIDSGKACWCTHVCFIHDSLRHSRTAQLYEAPKNYIKNYIG